MRFHSALPKKKSLFFLIGPPTEPPNWLRVKACLGFPWALSKKSCVANLDTRLYSYAEPWKAFEPLFVARFTTAEDARPYSAVKLLVRTLYSCTESNGMVWPTEAVNSLLFAAPSSKTFVPAERKPLNETPTPRPLGSPSEAVPTNDAKA